MYLSVKFATNVFRTSKTSSSQRTAAIDHDDEILMCNTDLVTNALLLIATILFETQTQRIFLGAFAVTPDWCDHSLMARIQTATTCHGARRPILPIVQLAISITRHSVARALFVWSVALLTTVLGLGDDVASARFNTALALLCACGPARPL